MSLCIYISAHVTQHIKNWSNLHHLQLHFKYTSTVQIFDSYDHFPNHMSFVSVLWHLQCEITILLKMSCLYHVQPCRKKYTKYLLRRDFEEISAINKNKVSTMTIGYPISMRKFFSINVRFAWNYTNLYTKLIQISQYIHTINHLNLKSLIFATTMAAILNQRSMQKEKSSTYSKFFLLFC